MGEMEGVKEARDIEFIHRMRVASRRLRTAMTLFDDCLPSRKKETWNRNIRQITRSLGSARDTDVQIEWLEKFIQSQKDKKVILGVQRLILRLSQQRARLQKGVIAAIDQLIKSNILIEMQAKYAPLAESEDVGAYPSDLYLFARQAILEHFQDMVNYDQVVHSPENIAELHAMRISAKKLRYTLEIFLPIYPESLKKILTIIKTIQEQLGNIHDCDVWLSYLPQYLNEESNRMIEFLGNARMMYRYAHGIHFLEEDRKTIRRQLYNEFIQSWDAWGQGGVWNQLKQVVSTPVLDPRSLFPPVGDTSRREGSRIE